ncbi:MAG: hypothetical protein ABI781_06490 [Burkholderiales bacterium]
MKASVYLQIEFFLLIAFSVVVPALIFWVMLAKRTISRTAVLLLGLVLIAVAGIDVALLRLLATKAAGSGALIDDNVFASEVSLGLYLLPALFAGIGINLVSHVLIHHLGSAERRFDQNHPPR